MRPGLSHLCGVIRKSTGLRHAISFFLFALGFCGLCNAQQASPHGRLDRLTPLGIEQVRDAVLLARPSSELSADTKLLTVTRRPDLEDLLSTLVHVRETDGLYLYQVEIPPQASFDGPWTWIIAVAAQRPGAYELYSFERKAKRADVEREFNRFASQLSLSLSKYELAKFAAFFLETAIPMSPGELVLDQDALRDAVGLNYFTTYDEVWRSLDAYSQWWQALPDREKMQAFAPRTEIEKNGRYLVTLNRVVATEGAHPQLQQWQVEISLEGNVRITAMRAILPTTARWIFYDSPEQPNVAPFRP
jgi:hypothetical protein